MRFVSLAQENIIDISIFGATPFFKIFFSSRFQGLGLDLRVHPNTLVSLSNSAGHVRLSLELQSAAPGEQGTEVCSRFKAFSAGFCEVPVSDLARVLGAWYKTLGGLMLPPSAGGVPRLFYRN